MRDLIVTLPDRFKVWWFRLRAWINALALRLVDKYLASREEERTPRPLNFEEIPTLYDFSNFTIVPGDYDLDSGIIAGWKYAPPPLQDEIGVL